MWNLNIRYVMLWTNCQHIYGETHVDIETPHKHRHPSPSERSYKPFEYEEIL